MTAPASISIGEVGTSIGAAALFFAGLVLAVFALYLVVLVLAALLHPRRKAPAAAREGTRLGVVVPAHDEAGSIAACVASLLTQTYPRELVEVVVVADNCSDETAAVAAAAGAEVLVRNEPEARGKGHALRWAFDRLLAGERPPDALVVVDADSAAVPTFLETLVRQIDSGPEVVQGESLLTDDGTADGALRAAAFLLVNRARPLGKAVLGLPASLSGNGMLFTRDVLLEHPWTAFTSAEDVEYHVQLLLAGVRPAFAPGAVLRSPPAPHARAAEEQQLRWEGGKLHVARAYGRRLLAAAARERSVALAVSALELSLPPVGFLTAAAVATSAAGGALVALGIVGVWALVPALAALASLPVYVLVGLRAANAPRSAYAALARAPFFVVRKTMTVYRLLRFRADSWVRTERSTP
jgi:1,2-diacylglycerol 3-beta-glucosyltransferase